MTWTFSDSLCFWVTLELLRLGQGALRKFSCHSANMVK